MAPFVVKIWLRVWTSICSDREMLSTEAVCGKEDYVLATYCFATLSFLKWILGSFYFRRTTLVECFWILYSWYALILKKFIDLFRESVTLRNYSKKPVISYFLALLLQVGRRAWDITLKYFEVCWISLTFLERSHGSLALLSAMKTW